MTASRVCIFTICSNNYMPMARAFIAAAKTFHPQADMIICLVDERLPSRDIYDVDAEIVTIDTLRIPHLKSFAFRYDVTELNTAAKPFMFLYLMEERGYETVLYFDPDIEIYAPLDAVLGPLEDGASLVLTPHVLHPSEGADEPNDLGFMRAGAYNLGFLGARRGEESREILRWWSRWLLFNCVNNQPTGLFVDQKFMDLVPGFGASVAILRDPGLNVAYWNLTQRRLEREDGRWTVDGQSLVFFHFSGFNVNEPARLSKYTRLFNQNLEQPLDELVSAYAERLSRLGHGSLSKSSYAYGRFASGTPIPNVARRLLRERHPGWPSDPFDTFEAQLHQPAPAVPQTSSTIVVTNLMAYLHATTAALQRIDLAEDDGRRVLVDWFVKHAMRELDLDARIVAPVAQRLGAAIPATPTKDGVRRTTIDLSVAPSASQADAETISRLVCCALDATDLPIRHCASVTQPSGITPAETVLARVKLPATRAAAANLTTGKTDDAARADYAISVVACDMSDLSPAGWMALEQADELWAPSRHLQLSLAQSFTKPALYMPLPYRAAVVSDRSRNDYGLPSQRFLFIQVVDGSAAIERTNLAGLVEAFRRAFPIASSARPGLVISMTGDTQPGDVPEALRAAVEDDAGVFVIARHLARQDVSTLISLCDAAVSLHRAEAVGMFVADAMLLGRPVIATDYAATTDLVAPATGFPVDYRLVPVPFTASRGGPQQVWAEPDLDHAAWLMRRLVASPAEAEPFAARASEHLRRHHSLQHVASRQLARLREINFNV